MVSSIDRRLRKATKAADKLGGRCQICGGLPCALWFQPGPKLPASQMCGCHKVGDLGAFWRPLLMEAEAGKETTGTVKFHNIAGGSSYE